MDKEYYRILDNLKAFPNSDIIDEIRNYVIEQNKTNCFLKEQLSKTFNILEINNIHHNISDNISDKLCI